jgi:putative NADH-flavin reductase
MHLSIIGATGRTGRLLVDQALAAGHTVTAFARNRDKLADQRDLDTDGLRVIIGDVRDAGAIDAAVEDADAVLLAIGHTSTSTSDVQTVGTRHVLQAMHSHGVQRLVSETGAGVRSPNDPPPGLGSRFMRGLMGLVAGDMLADAEHHADLIRQSDLDWTIVRAPRLTDGPHTGTYRHGYLDLGVTASISRADVADFMLSIVEDGRYVQEAPVVTS